MAQDCFVIKTKGTANDASLSIFGNAAVLYTNASVIDKSFYLETIDKSPIVIRCTGGGTFDNGEREVHLPLGYGVVTMGTVTAKTIISISQYRKLSKIICNNGTSNPLSGTSAYWYANDTSLFAKMKYLKEYCVRNGLTDLTPFASVTSLEKLCVRNAIFGNGATINVLGSCINLTELYLSGSKNLGGELKTLADAMVTAGRVNGTFAIQCNGVILDEVGGSAIANGTYKTITFTENGYTIR